jgi:hypothetical protein
VDIVAGWNGRTVVGYGIEVTSRGEQADAQTGPPPNAARHRDASR